MVSMTLSVSEELKQEMDNFKEINWSEIAREAIKQRLILLEKFKKFTKNSEITEKDALKWGKEVSKAVSKRLRQRVKG